MGFFNKQRTDGRTYDGQGEERKGFIDRISFNGEAEDIVWKFPYDNLSIGTQLIVNHSQEAIFLRGGAVCDIFGEGTHTLSTNNIPVLQKLINLPFGGRTPFTAEVYFVSKTVRRNLKFGTINAVPVRDPLYSIPIPVRAFGEYGIRVVDASMLLGELVGTLHTFDTESIIEQFKSVVLQQLNASFGQFVKQERISVVDLPAYSPQMAQYLQNCLKSEFARYGISLENFNLASINYDEGHPNVQKVLEAQANAAAEIFEAQGRAQRRNIEQYTFQEERQFDVLETAAGNEGGSGQMMGAGMGLGMGVGIGGAFGTQMGNIAGVMTSQQPSSAATPPPPPMPVTYHVLVNNVQQGPYDLPTLQQMAQNGTLTRDTYVWKNGMPQWTKAGDSTELQSLFSAVPPPPPIL